MSGVSLLGFLVGPGLKGAADLLADDEIQQKYCAV